MRRYFESRLWLFGDSFVQHNSNWVHDLSVKCEAQVNHLGFGGGSLQFLLLDLMRYEKLIRKDDRVVIAITAPTRFYLKGKHYHSYKELEYYNKEIYKEQEVEAFKDFILQLYDGHSDSIYKGAIASHIINTVIPNLNTKHVQYIFTINPKVYTQQKILFIDQSQPPGFFETAVDFLKTHDVEGYDEENNNAVEILTGPDNHWIDHPDYHDYFWNIYDKHFSILYPKDNPPSI